MKKLFSFALLIAASAIICLSCSGDHDGAESPVKPVGPSRAPMSWKLYDGNFVTDQDVMVSNDSSSMNVSKAFIARLSKKETIEQGDVISLFNHGYLDYFEVGKTAENGEHYVTCNVKKIGLERALGILKVDMDNVHLSTEVYADKSKPKRVNNSGEADANGIINYDMYVEKSSGETVIHPSAILVPAYREGANADDEDAVAPDGFVGCYIGQADDLDVANGWFSNVISAVKKVTNVVIAPVKTVVKVAADTAELLGKLAFGGDYTKEYKVIDINHEFTGHRWDLVEGVESLVKDDNADNKDGDKDDDKDDDKDKDNDNSPWTKEEWEKEVKAKAYVTLNGHANAHAGARIDLVLKPASVEKFSVSAFADADIDVKAKLELGVAAEASRPVVLHRFPCKELMFDIGPVPVLIVIYPEIIWNTSFKGEILAYAEASVNYKMNYVATMQFLPEFKTYVDPKQEPTGDASLDKFGFKGNIDLRTGVYFRSAWHLYGVAGPVFDIGCSVSAEGDFDAFKEKDKAPVGHAHAELNINIGDIQASGQISFPPLQDYSKWLYEKLTWKTDNLIDVPPLYVKHLYEGDWGDDIDDNNEVKKMVYPPLMQ